MDTFIGLDQGLRIVANGIAKVVKILEGLGEPQIKSEFTSDDYMELYSTIYTMCTQKPPHEYSSQLYAIYRETFQDYLTTKVLPSLREKHGEFMLRELVRRWTNHKLMVRWLSRFFHYIDRYYVSRRSLPLLNQVSLGCFRDMVYNECKVNARDAVLSLIDREREGEQIDRALLKNVLDISLEIGSGDMAYYYVNDFEKSILKASVAYYSRKASNWIIEDSYADYMIKTDAYLKREKESAAHYLPSSSQEELLEKVQHELLSVYCPQLLEKKDLGFRDLLIAEKVEDLSMLFRLLLNIPRGVEPVSAIFQTHVIDEGTTLVKQAEDSGSNKKVFVRNVLDLHDKFSSYVNDCFRNHILYRKALKEAFATICSKSVSGSSCPELIAEFCDTVLRKAENKKSSDEATEDTLEKVLKLIACIVDKDLFGEFYRCRGACYSIRVVTKMERWTNHKLMARLLSRLFSYLDRYYVYRKTLPKLKEVSLVCFRDLVYNEIKVNARVAVLSLIDREREGEQIDRALLKNVLDVFLEIGSEETTYYEKDFENSMLKASVAYYTRKASNWMMDSYADYMIKTDAHLKREKESVAHYLPSSTQEKLLQEVRDELYVYCPQLLETKDLGFHDSLIAEKVEDLSRMFRLLLKGPRGAEPVCAIFKTHVIDEGTALIKQAEDSGSNKKVFVRNVLDLQDKFSAYVDVYLRNHILYRKALKEAFAAICSKSVSGSSCPELIAAFCDTLLKKGGSEKLTDEAIEDTLEKVLKLIACTDDKDLFGEFYRKKMSRRLLFDKSCNDEHERSFVAKLKQECGSNFTSKMEGMLKDMTLSRENQASFDEYLSQNPNANSCIDFSATVLTSGFWPRYKTVDLNLPPEMAKCVDAFREFYKKKAENRKLTFNNSLGSCIVNGTFDAKTIELSVTTHQAATLLLFNDSDKLSFREIATRLNLPDDDVIRLLHSLSCGRYKILNKEPNTKTISRADTFEYNSKFTDVMRKIKVPLPPLEERHKVIEDVDKDRAYTIDASIVRIMKSRKVLGYKQLVSECVGQLNRMFKPDVKAINKRIERLIELDYLERDEDNNKIKYLA